MALRDILLAIDQEGHAEVEAMTAEAQQAAEGLLEEARRDAVRIAEEAERSRDDELRREVAGVRSRARLEVRRALRAAREEVFARALEDVRLQLATAREGPRWRALLRSLLEEARAALPSATRARVDPRDLALVQVLLDELGLDLQLEGSLSTWGGVWLEDDRGRDVRNTLEERLRLAQPLLRERVARALGDPHPGGGAA